MRGINLCALYEAHKRRIIKVRRTFFVPVRTHPQIYNTRQVCHSDVILQFFKPSSTLPTPGETGIGVLAMDEANTAVQRELSRQSSTSKKRKVSTAFSDQTHADIGKYTAENGNAAAMRKFR